MKSIRSNTDRVKIRCSWEVLKRQPFFVDLLKKVGSIDQGKAAGTPISSKIMKKALGLVGSHYQELCDRRGYESRATEAECFEQHYYVTYLRMRSKYDKVTAEREAMDCFLGPGPVGPIICGNWRVDLWDIEAERFWFSKKGLSAPESLWASRWVDRDHKTISLKIRLDYKRGEVIETLNKLLALLEEEGKFLKMDLGKVRERPSRKWKHDLAAKFNDWFEVWDKKSAGQSFPAIARGMFPEKFGDADWFDGDGRADGKEAADDYRSADAAANAHDDAIRMVARYFRAAKERIRRGPWR